MDRLKCILLVLMLLPLVFVVGCDSVIEVRVVTLTATPTLPVDAATESSPAPENAEATPEPTSTPTPTYAPPTETPEPPTPTPGPPPEPPTPAGEPGPTRIQFEPGATSATVTGHVEQNGVERYMVRAFAGQTMEVVITSPKDDVLLTIVGADGVPLKRYVDGTADWHGELYSTQDYFIWAESVGEETSYELTVTISPLSLPKPTRIQFERGATSATVEGNLEPRAFARYVLRALHGQRMEVHVSPVEAVGIAVEGQDGSFWSVPPWEGTLTIEALPATQDYVITLAIAPSTGVTRYTMEVSVPPP